MISHRSRASFSILLAGLGGGPLGAVPAYADSEAAVPDTIVVTADRLSSPESRVASSLTVITQAEIERKQAATVADLLRGVPGVHVSSSGGAGQPTTVFLRGTNAGHTLVMIDGVKANDPLNTTRAFDFAQLSTDNVERIEIIRGPQSVMYGSDAIGGVINVITKKGSGRANASVEGEYGAYNTYAARGNVAGGEKALHYSISGEFLSSDGFSAANESLGNTGKNRRSSTVVGGRFGGNAAEKIELDFATRYSYAKFDNDMSGGPPGSFTGDDPNYTGTEKQFQAGVKARSSHFAQWEPILGLSYLSNKRTADNLPDSVHSETRHDSYDSDRIQAEAQNNFFLDDRNTIAFVLETETERGTSIQDDGSTVTTNSDKSNSKTAVLAQHRFSSESWFSSAGARLDHYGQFGSQWTFRAAPGLKVARTGTTLKGSVGTGFKAPSLFQLYSSYGSQSLRPETSFSYDFGAQQSLLGGTATLSATYFRSEMKDLIDFGASTYENVGRASSEGFELGGSITPDRDLTISTQYTFTLAKNDDTGLALLRRPRNQLSGEFAYGSLRERLQGSFVWKYVGTRADLDSVSFTRKDMPSYTVFGLTGSYWLVPDLRLFGRIENLLDRKYEEVDGYGTAGRSLYLGIRKDI